MKVEIHSEAEEREQQKGKIILRQMHKGRQSQRKQKKIGKNMAKIRYNLIYRIKSSEGGEKVKLYSNS